MPMLEKNEEYRTLKEKIEKQEKKKILAVHIPGTGGRAQSGYPTRVALAGLNMALGQSLPIIELSGVGNADEPAVLRNTTRLDLQEDPFSSQGISLKSISSEDEMVSSPEQVNEIRNNALVTTVGANRAGSWGGAGEKQNNQVVLNALETLKSDQCLPEEMILSGHSRGAINAIYLANEIYAKYGDKIKIHLLLTDPVPGPFHEMEWKKRVIPPNVATFTAFYADSEDSALFVPHDLSRLTFTSNQTVVTSYSVANTTHNTIGSVPAVSKACYDVYAGVFGVEKDSSSLKAFGVSTPRDTSTMHSQAVFARRNCQYVAKTNNLEGLNSQLQTNLKKVRQDFDTRPQQEIKPPHVVECLPPKEEADDQLMTRKRFSALNAAYREGNYYNVSSNQLAAYLLIVPTLGFSSLFFMGMQSYDNKFAIVALGLLTFNIATALHLAVTTTYKLGHNMLKGGFFMPGYQSQPVKAAAEQKTEAGQGDGVKSNFSSSQ